MLSSSERGVDLGTVDRFMTVSTETGPLRETGRVILAANQNLSARSLLLKMTFQAQVGVPFLEHASVH